jgi:hypothetical protein
MLRDAPESENQDETVEAEPNEIYCAACGHLVTRTDWRMSVAGAHEHTFFNPAGIVFRVVCFKEAPGVGVRGDATAEFTWFDGYKWRIALCGGCAGHLGWRFEAGDIFFGLIKSKLTMTLSGRQ